jgi:hypothetical protein
MIKYRLICDKEHEFDGWFADSAAFDTQKTDGLLACALCGSTKVSKAIMAPAVPKKTNQQKDEAHQIRHMMQKVSTHVEENFDYVGTDFAEEARKIHYGEREARDIYGETSLDDAKELLEEGVPVAPLPGLSPKEKN